MPDWYLCLLILSVEWIVLRSTEEITKVHFWVSVRVIVETELPWYWTVPVISCGSDRITRRKEKLSAHSLPLCILEVWCELLSLPWQNETAETMRQRTLSPLNLFMSGFLSHRQENEHDIYFIIEFFKISFDSSLSERDLLSLKFCLYCKRGNGCPLLWNIFPSMLL